MYLAITYLNHKQDLKLKYLLGRVGTSEPSTSNFGDDEYVINKKKKKSKYL